MVKITLLNLSHNKTTKMNQRKRRNLEKDGQLLSWTWNQELILVVINKVAKKNNLMKKKKSIWHSKKN